MQDIPQLVDAAAAYRQELVAFMVDLVRLPSVNGRDTEQAVARRILAEGERLGLKGQLVVADPQRPNVLVQWGHGEKGFALVGHMDTVAEGDPAAWSTPPFAAEIHNGRLLGRGAADNKAGIAVGLYTLALMRDHGMLDPEKTRIILAGVVDEESGASSPLGVHTLLDRRMLPVQGAIYTYTSDIVCVGHRGLLRLEVTARGRSIHTGSDAWSRGQGGVNAVTGLAALLLALEELTVPYPPHPAFDHLGFTITPGTFITGGEFESIVPSTARAMIDVRLMPGQAPSSITGIIQQLIENIESERPGLSIAFDVKNSLPAAAIELDHPLVQLAKNYAKHVTGRVWRACGAGPANEGYMLIEAGIPTLPGFGPTGGNAHAPDEWVALDSLTPTMAIYAGAIQDYLASQ